MFVFGRRKSVTKLPTAAEPGAFERYDIALYSRYCCINNAAVTYAVIIVITVPAVG